MNDNLFQAKQEFIDQRINYHRKNEPPAVNQAFMELRTCVEVLRAALSNEQTELLRAVENAYYSSDGESGRFFYVSGLHDAVSLLFDRGCRE